MSEVWDEQAARGRLERAKCQHPGPWRAVRFGGRARYHWDVDRPRDGRADAPDSEHFSILEDPSQALCEFIAAAPDDLRQALEQAARLRDTSLDTALDMLNEQIGDVGLWHPLKLVYDAAYWQACVALEAALGTPELAKESQVKADALLAAIRARFGTDTIEGELGRIALRLVPDVTTERLESLLATSLAVEALEPHAYEVEHAPNLPFVVRLYERPVPDGMLEERCWASAPTLAQAVDKALEEVENGDER